MIITLFTSQLSFIQCGVVLYSVVMKTEGNRKTTLKSSHQTRIHSLESSVIQSGLIQYQINIVKSSGSRGICIQLSSFIDSSHRTCVLFLSRSMPHSLRNLQNDNHFLDLSFYTDNPPTVNGVCSGLRPILHLSFVTTCLVVFV